MGIEIERKFLVSSNEWRKMGDTVRYSQGYLVSDGYRSVRIRVAGEKAFLTIKGTSKGFSRPEFEYGIPLEEAIEMFKLCSLPIIEKFRTKVLFQGKTWEVDEFQGENKGLIMAEIELKSEEDTFSIPPWIGKEVTGDIRYFNSRLAINPYKNWRK
ncbi:MAG: CYTH domain-containing protein [Mariniphaga sp.]